MIIIRMPPAVPGSADVEVILQDRPAGDPIEVWVREIPPEGERQAPAWSRASSVDEIRFVKPLPLMETGNWRAQIRLKGIRGEGFIEVPVSARTASPKNMGNALATLLLGLLVILYTSGYQLLVGLGRDAQRRGDQEISASAVRKGRIFAAVGLTVLTGYIAILSYVWRLAHIHTRSSSAPPLTAQFSRQSPTTIEIALIDSYGRPLFDVLPDHGKLMHVFLIDFPKATRFFHLHPTMISEGRFLLHVPGAEPGAYQVFVDILRSTGDGETLTTKIDVPSTALQVAAGDPDDSYSSQPAFGSLPLNETSYSAAADRRIIWIDRPATPLKKGEFHRFTFQLTDAGGKALDLQPYMGMHGHLLIARSDAQSFAHVHPMGTVPGRAMTMDGMDHESKGRVSFPYGFPDKGLYRLWVQVKHDRVLTGVFDVEVR